MIVGKGFALHIQEWNLCQQNKLFFLFGSFQQHDMRVCFLNQKNQKQTKINFKCLQKELLLPKRANLKLFDR
jgi:hypothetical protein